MSEKTAGSALLLSLVIGICALALYGAHPPKPWCEAGVTESLFTACERMASR